MAYKTRLGGSDATFSTMMENGFGIVTVMNAEVYDAYSADYYQGKTAYDIAHANHGKPLCIIDTLKIANVPQEGPSKTVTGGQFSNPLIKFGKSARLEMQDALGRAEAIEALGGGLVEYNDGEISGLHFGEDFVGPKLIIGKSFFIDRKTGEQVNVKIVFYQFLPDSIFNLTQDAEGDATVFDMNGDLLTTVILVGNKQEDLVLHGVFYSIVEDKIDATIVAREFDTRGDANKVAGSLVPGQQIKISGQVEVVKSVTLDATGYKLTLESDE